MGERVVFDPVRFAQSQARPVIPLNYGGAENIASRGLHAFTGAVRRVSDACAPWLAALVNQLGGVRQVGLAAGCGLALGGLGFALDPLDWTIGGFMFVGGVLIGLSVRLCAKERRI